jgi:regulator of protease activity HflC (stomatin/prohibitin superfamily)
MMEQKNKVNGVLPAYLSLVFIGAISVMLFATYGMSKYLPYLLTAIILTFLTIASLFLALLGIEIKVDRPTKKELGEDAKKLKKLLASVAFVFRIALYTICVAYNKAHKALQLLLSTGTIIVGVLYFGMMIRRSTSLFKLSFWQPVLLVVLFVLSIIFDKWCKHIEVENKRITATLSNIRRIFYLLRVTFIVTSVSTLVYLLGFGDLQKYVVWILATVFFYVSIFTLISIGVLLIRKEISSCPMLIIPLPFLNSNKSDLGVISFLEKNTGITMRGLWSMRFVKTVLPYTFIFIFVLLWISTGLVQVEPYQQGAVYRLGKLLDQPLEPGLHMTLPYPLDKVEIYDTETVNKITIGYAGKDDSDNLWTGTHGSNEHKLLLGNGNELVSVNLRVEYKISDLTKYLRASTSPAAILEARSYELITSRIIVSDLEDLLSVDRAEFTKEYTAELSKILCEDDIGLELVTVVLESIHPPLEIAAIYQEVVGAEIQAEARIKRAESDANVKLTDATAQKSASVNAANAEYHQKLAVATADVSEFLASVEAAEGHPDAYHYYKYLKAVSTAYGKSKLIIVGDGVDSSKIYFGNIGNLIVE